MKRSRRNKDRKYQYILYDKEGVIETMTGTLAEMGYYLGIGESATYRAMKEQRKRFGKPKKDRELVRISAADLF